MTDEVTPPAPLKVVFILGFPRSGSTVLGNILGQIDGWFFTGELRELWRRSDLSSSRCGCGRSVAECSLWHSVLVRTSTSPTSTGAARPGVVDHQRRALRWGGMRYAMARRPPTADRDPACAAYLEALADTYRTIAAATGAHVLVDSSKWPVDAAMAEFADGVEPWFVHLVRDPRGVVHSRQRARERRRAAARHPRPILAKLRPLWLAYDGAGWGALNLIARHATWRPAPPRWQELSYEAFSQRPEETLRSLLDGLAEDDAELPFAGPSTVTLEENHAVAGNRNRHTSGEVVISPDEGWRRGLRRWEQRLVAVAGLPSLRAHGYHLDGGGDGPQLGSSPSLSSKAGSRHTQSASGGTSASASLP